MKKIEIEGYGKVFLSGIDFKSGDGFVCDNNGNPLVRFSESVRGATGYKDKDGNIVASSGVHKKVNVKGEDIVLAKLKATNKLAKGDFVVKTKAEGDYEFSNGVERKVYVITTDSNDLRTFLNDGSSLVFGFVAGAGFKAWKGILRKHTTKTGKELYTLGLTRGNLDKAFDEFADEPIEVEIGVFPDNSNVRKLVDLD